MLFPKLSTSVMYLRSKIWLGILIKSWLTQASMKKIACVDAELCTGLLLQSNMLSSLGLAR